MNIACIGGGDKTAVFNYLLQDIDPGEMLIIPSACSTSKSYNKKVSAIRTFFEGLGLSSIVLHEYDEAPSITKVQHELGKTSLVYTIGGNSPHMLRMFQQHGTGSELLKAINRGVNYAGSSAGALCVFDRMHSNVSSNPASEDWDFAYLSGLGIFNGVATAHAQGHDITRYGMRQDSRFDNLITRLPDDISCGLAIEDGTSIVFGDRPAIIRSTTDSQAHVLTRTKTIVEARPLDDVEQLMPFYKTID